jgi:beta-lactam-binding protein with PASTA domain
MTSEWSAPGEEPPKRTRASLLAAVATAVVVLAAAGATGGWLLAGSGKNNQAEDTSPASPSPQLSSSVPVVGPTTATSRSASTSPAAGEFALPNVIGQDFGGARKTLRDLKLGVRVTFGEDGSAGIVTRTTPDAGSAVHAGITVRLRVAGDPPPVPVPGVVGMGCVEAGQAIADNGLEPKYSSGRSGQVLKQDPQPPAEVRWNDTVKLYCGKPAESSASSSPYA